MTETTQIWKPEGWANITLKDSWDAIMERSWSAPRVGELTLPQLMTLSLQGDKSPVGIYIFTNDEDIYYVGKTHGRSLAERLICHLDSRSVAPDEVRIAQEGDTWESIARARGATQAKIKKLNKGVELKPGARIRLTANWSMSSLVGKMVEKKEAATRTEAVAKVMNMRTIWMQVLPPEAAPMRHQEHVEVIEKRLLWSGAAHPKLNSDRGNLGARFGVEGIPHDRHPDLRLGCQAYLTRTGKV